MSVETFETFIADALARYARTGAERTAGKARSSGPAATPRLVPRAQRAPHRLHEAGSLQVGTWRLHSVTQVTLHTTCTCGASYTMPNNSLMLEWRDSRSDATRREAVNSTEAVKWLRAGVPSTHQDLHGTIEVCHECLAHYLKEKTA